MTVLIGRAGLPPIHEEGFVAVTGVRLEGALGLIRSHAAATASDHCAAASALKIRNVDRETRWRWRLKVL